MSYVGLGAVKGGAVAPPPTLPQTQQEAALAKALAKAIAEAQAKAAPPCYVGHGAPAVTPWGTLYQPSDPLLSASPWGKDPWIDRDVSWNCGVGSPCQGKNCLKSKYWNDALYLQRKGAQTMYYVKEQRVRRLLSWLANPYYGFPSGLQAFAYDASFCGSVQVRWHIINAVRQALNVLNQRYPKSRWKKVRNQVIVECGNCTGSYSRYRDTTTRFAKEISGKCLGATVMASPGYCQKHRGWDGKGTVSEILWKRYIPVGAAIVVKDGQLIPTPWLASLLTCLVPKWNVVPSLDLLKIAATLKKF